MEANWLHIVAGRDGFSQIADVRLGQMYTGVDTRLKNVCILFVLAQRTRRRNKKTASQFASMS